nr:hypothetical protein CFP56_13054 [Quercus suber]
MNVEGKGGDERGRPGSKYVNLCFYFIVFPARDCNGGVEEVRAVISYGDEIVLRSELADRTARSPFLIPLEHSCTARKSLAVSWRKADVVLFSC